MSETRWIEAAGGAVVRRADGSAQIVAVHRPRYDDWSLPKGKLESGESHRRAALREVEEETGLSCRALEELPRVEYRDPKGRRKRVRYWRMTPTAGDLSLRPPDDEVDEVRWLDRAAVKQRLTYSRDRDLALLALAATNSDADPS